MLEPIIELKGVSFVTQNETIIKDISYTYEEGKTTALVGPSGGGKSTMLKLSAGLLVPSGGEVYYRGMNIVDMNRAQNLSFRREGAVVFQDSALWANQSLYQILELPLRIHFPKMSRAEREERIREVTAEAGYKRDLSIRPAKLSMGEQKLIAFARAMLCHPKLLFLDEWTESLDDEAARRLLGIVTRFKAEGGTIILISHNLRVIQDIADHVIIIIEGQLSMQVTGEQMALDARLAKLVEKEINTCDSEYALLIR
ncbi:MAG: ATP-binding cassette domain-containing protein [Treponema sp.]|jgi:ABC-type multidrug transport system ATPase subunit|nr:ATP-binding cassette domain-containing protein [Treponema sp.]